MIATLLLLTQKLLDFIKGHLPQLPDDDPLTIDTIEETSFYMNNSITESMIIFSNCEHLDLTTRGRIVQKHKYDRNNDDLRFNITCRRKKNIPPAGTNFLNIGLSSQKKMDCEAEGSRLGLAGTLSSPRKASISPRGILSTPESDCNSNNLNFTNDMSTCPENMQDFNDGFHHNSEYQWFLDYGYKDNPQHQQSVFSVLSSHDLLYYDDIARDLDANLAEVDMDDFHRGDIHSVLSTLPNMCSSDIQGVEEREMFASVSESMMIKFGLDYTSPHSSSQEDNSNSMSLCKSELLFSPVRESIVPNGNLSVDSLDLSENDINLLITCQANKTNYTIAFEGSTEMGSDDSVCPDIVDNADTSTEDTTSTKGPHDEEKHIFSSNINNSMTRSDSVYTTWSKIKQRSSDQLLVNRQSNMNSNSPGTEHNNAINLSSKTIKSLSLPNLFRQNRKKSFGMSVSSRLSCELSSPVGNEKQCVKLYNIHKSNNSNTCSQSISSTGENIHDRPHNLNLVKLFIKQKSASHEGMCNYASDRPLYSSYCEGRYSVKNNLEKDYDCNVACKNSDKSRILKQRSSRNGFEDSLVARNVLKNEDALIKENSDSESVDQITDDVSKQISESVEQITESYSTSEPLDHNRIDESSQKRQKKYSYAFSLNNNNNNNNALNNQKNRNFSDESTQENGSNTESTDMTCNCRNVSKILSKTKVMEKSIQTSKLIDPSETHKAKEVKVPAYILYPNYSLPNLEFLKEEHYVQNIDFTKIFLRPQTFKETECQSQGVKRRGKASGKRPFSVNDIESLKKTGFKHVRDWDSLTFLLPKEYKEFLQDIPEIMAQLKDIKNMKEDLKPLFCLNGPSKKVNKRPISCDSNFFTGDCRNSNHSSTATQPSSGYRGSSTMLNSNNSNLISSPKNQSSGFRYDNNDSIFNSRKYTPPKSGLSLQSQRNDESSAKPSPPRSILRNNSLDSAKYTCKTQKENANKRYSMIEFSEKNSDNEKVNRRKSTQDPYYLKSPQKYKESFESKFGRNQIQPKRDKFDFDEDTLSFKSSNLDSDMRRLEELLEISAVFGESVESVTESDMQKLRSQVSRFLTMQKNLEKVSDCLQIVNEKSNPHRTEDDSYKGKRLEDIKYSQTPNNTPEHKKKSNLVLEGYETDLELSCCAECYGENCRNSGHLSRDHKSDVNGKEETLKELKKTVSFAEKISSLMNEPSNKDLTPPNSPIAPSLQTIHKAYQSKCLKLVDVPITEESLEVSPGGSPKNKDNDLFFLHKKDLIMDVKNAVDNIIKRSTINDDKLQEELSNLCLHQLCPSLYAILSDGLKEEINTPFGAIRNCVWSVIEATSQQGPLTETLNHLVQRLNRDDVLSEGLVKFNAFIFGLLNVCSLDAWLSYLRTRDSLLHRYYNKPSLLLLSNSAGAPVRILMDKLIHIIQPLSGIQFNLDLMYQAKLLHRSLQNLNCLLENTNNDLMSPSKHLVLLKLVQSIQNSISQPSDGRKNRQSSEEMEKVINDSSVTQLLEKSMSSKPPVNSRPRPRSGCDILNSDNTNDVASCLKKRWSGIQLNSKLLQAFERLGEESESEYTDSLDNRGTQSPSIKTLSLKRLQNSDDTIEEVSNAWNDTDSSETKTKEQRRNILSNLNKKTCSSQDSLKTDRDNSEKLLSDIGNSALNSGHKYKRIQQKWEKLSRNSGSEYTDGQNTPVQVASPVHRSRVGNFKRWTPDKANCDPNIPLTSPTSRMSRIPRPVSSPVQATPTNEKQAGYGKKCVPPSNSSNNLQDKKQGKANINNKSNSLKLKNSSSNRVSRVDEAADAEVKSRAVRPSSLPYRGASTLPQKKNTPVRASSMSLNRRPDKKSVNAPRLVRTLSHRLPSDSGHLSFNEGEKLKVVLEVDETWLLCCRGTQKGLVPKSAVIPIPEHIRY